MRLVNRCTCGAALLVLAVGCASTTSFPAGVPADLSVGGPTRGDAGVGEPGRRRDTPLAREWRQWESLACELALTAQTVAVPPAGQTPADGGDTESELAKQTQNPVADLISLPFQNNTGFNVGPGSDVSNTLNIQPVIPFKLGDDWNLITRTILPVVYQPELVPGFGNEWGLGDTAVSAFFSPAAPSKFIWGVGPVLLLPTSTGDSLGAGEWGAGAGAVGLTMTGPWVVGALAQNVWSFEGSVNQLLLQPFVNYNLGDGWYLVSAPIVTAVWEAENVWDVPIGGGAGKVFTIGKQPVNMSVQTYYHFGDRLGAPEWSLRIQVQFLFPKGKKK